MNMTEHSMVETAFAERMAAVQAEIVRACAAAGRSPAEVTLVAVSKTHPSESVLAALAAGQVDFGENRPEDAVQKIAAVAEKMPSGAAIRWHMIGHVQSRKARLIPGRFTLIHSLDSVALTEKISRLALDAGIVVDALLEMNVSGEEAKSGFAAAGWDQSATLRESLWNDIRSILTMTGVRVHGLMTMAPLADDPEQARPTFAALRRLRDALREDFPGTDWERLSMGMSDDYLVAIQEGATMIRLGRVLFGPRA